MAMSFSERDPYKYRKCLLVNAGNFRIVYHRTVTTTERPEPKYTLLSVQIQKANVKAAIFDGLKTVSYTHLTLPTTPYV